MKKIIIFLICFLAFPISSMAIDLCTTEQIKQQNEYINNVDISYGVQINGDVPTYTVTVKNLRNNMIISYLDKNVTVNESTYTFTTNESKSITFSIRSKECKTGSRLNPFVYTSKSITLPNYNKYASRAECEEFRENYICQKWSSYNGNEESFKNDIKKLQENKERIKQKEEPVKIEVKKKWYEVVREIISKFWWAFIIVIFIFTGLFYIIKSKQKKNEFDFKL